MQTRHRARYRDRRAGRRTRWLTRGPTDSDPNLIRATERRLRRQDNLVEQITKRGRCCQRHFDVGHHNQPLPPGVILEDFDQCRRQRQIDDAAVQGDGWNLVGIDDWRLD